MFSNRTNWDLSPNRLADISAELKQAGTPVVDLTVSNPTHCGFDLPWERLLASFSDSSNMIYDADPHGLTRARAAIAGYYRDHGISVPLEHIFLTASTSEAYGFLFRLLADPGDHVAFPKPGYPLFEFLAGLHDLDWRTYALFYHDRWALDAESLHDSLDGGAKAVILVNPNNPTGSCLSQEERRAITGAALARRVPIICDEVFLDYCYSDERKISLAGHAEHLTFVLGGLSKALALPQMKCSWIVMNGPPDLVQEAAARLEMIADTYLSVNTPVQNALPQWMAMRHEIQALVLERVRANRSFLDGIVKEAGGGAAVLNADGGWSAVVHSPAIEDEEAFILALLQEDHVCVHPGYFFDFQDPGYAVISLLPEEQVFQDGARRMVKRMAA